MIAPTDMALLTRAWSQTPVFGLEDYLPGGQAAWFVSGNNVIQAMLPRLAVEKVKTQLAAHQKAPFLSLVSDYAFCGAALYSNLHPINLHDDRKRNIRWTPCLLTLAGLGVDPASSSFERRVAIFRKLDFYRALQEQTAERIAMLKHDYLYEEWTEGVQSLDGELELLDYFVEQLEMCLADSGDLALLASTTATEQRLAEFAELVLWHEQKLSRFFERFLNVQTCLSEKKRLTIHAILLRGRMRRFGAVKRLRDIRRHFRTLVRTIFKQLNDQSGPDEFSAMFLRTFAKTQFMTQMAFTHAKGNYH